MRPLPWQLRAPGFNGMQLQMRYAARMMRTCKTAEETFEALGGGPCRKGARGERRAKLSAKVETWLREINAGRKVSVVWK